MTKQEECDLFYKFIVEHGLLFSFLETLPNTKYKTIEEYCKRQTNIFDFFLGLFWQETREGFDFWAKVSNQWQHVCFKELGINLDEI